MSIATRSGLPCLQQLTQGGIIVLPAAQLMIFTDFTYGTHAIELHFDLDMDAQALKSISDGCADELTATDAYSSTWAVLLPAHSIEICCRALQRLLDDGISIRLKVAI